MIKNQARKLIDALPVDANWDDVMYQMYVQQKLEASLEAASKGKVIAHETVKKRLKRR